MKTRSKFFLPIYVALVLHYLYYLAFNNNNNIEMGACNAPTNVAERVDLLSNDDEAYINQMHCLIIDDWTYLNKTYICNASWLIDKLRP